MVENVAIALTAIVFTISLLTEERVLKKLLYSAIALFSMFAFRYADKPIWMKWVAIGMLATLVIPLLAKFIRIYLFANQQLEKDDV